MPTVDYNGKIREMTKAEIAALPAEDDPEPTVEARLAALEKSVNETLTARLNAVETKADQAVASTLKATTKS